MDSFDLLLLQETKIDEDSLLLLSNSKWKLNSGKAVNARGTCGGLATLWSEEKFHLKRWFVSQHWIFTELFHLLSKLTLALFNLYVPVNFWGKERVMEVFSRFLRCQFSLEFHYSWGS